MTNINYDKFPHTSIESGLLIRGWTDILAEIQHSIAKHRIIAVDFYPGVLEEEIYSNLAKLSVSEFYNTKTHLFKPEEQVKEMTARFMTNDVLFGYIAPLKMQDFFDMQKLADIKQKISNSSGTVLVAGIGSAMVVPDSATVIYIDMARWEIIQRFRRGQVSALGVDDRNESVSTQHKRGYFIDWRICDSYKDSLYPKVDYWIDTHIPNDPKMIDKTTFRKGIEATIARPFRVVPFFDPAPWGGQWMKEVCGLDKSKENYGWCFDCVPEENSLLFEVDGVTFEMPSINLVRTKSNELLGEPVVSRFGADFPIRFDLLDTIGGGSLSLQVHPTTQYIRDTFGMFYTQDESYYMIHAEEDACVYLGLKDGVDSLQMINDLRKAEKGEITFDAERYTNKIPAKKHDHFLIPGGTIHCSGPQGVVLEISSTPNLFTFKLWDWGRLGLDGKPRPINIEHGKNVIDWKRDTDYTQKYLVNAVEIVDQGDGWKEERTGLHKNEFIETRRHSFTKPVTHYTNDSVNVLHVLEGAELVVESPTGKFKPFVVHYAETFIVPASIEEYTIRPFATSQGKECITIKAFVRF